MENGYELQRLQEKYSILLIKSPTLLFSVSGINN